MAVVVNGRRSTSRQLYEHVVDVLGKDAVFPREHFGARADALWALRGASWALLLARQHALSA